MRRILAIAVLLEVISISAAFAQGTAEQRSACKDDAYRFCPYDVPNPTKTEACLRKYIHSISPACRHQFHKR
jgi:hypothetical protein